MARYQITHVRFDALDYVDDQSGATGRAIAWVRESRDPIGMQTLQSLVAIGERQRDKSYTGDARKSLNVAADRFRRALRNRARRFASLAQ